MCDYRGLYGPLPDKSQEQELAEANNWDMHGFVTDWNWLEPQDTRINEDFIVYIYETICCLHLNESIDMMLTRGGFYPDELAVYQADNLSFRVIEAQETRMEECAAAGKGWELYNDSRDQFAPTDRCDHWALNWMTVKSDE